MTPKRPQIAPRKPQDTPKLTYYPLVIFLLSSFFFRIAGGALLHFIAHTPNVSPGAETLGIALLYPHVGVSQSFSDFYLSFTQKIVMQAHKIVVGYHAHSGV